MKKDIESYIEHNKQYEDPLVRKWIQEKCIRDDLNMFEKLGFKKVIDENPKVRNLHIDIGSGAGGLLFKTAPYFKKVIGIEPSKVAIEIAKVFTKGVQNIEFINAGAVDAIRSLNLDESVFFTTSIVFSHLKDYYVVQCLKLINNAPLGSVLLFNEPYEKNIQRRLWYVRRKRWWAENLPSWTLSFREYTNDGYKYKYGIFGICIGMCVSPVNNYNTNILEDILWRIDGVFHFLLYLPGRRMRSLGGKLIRMISLSFYRKIQNL